MIRCKLYSLSSFSELFLHIYQTFNYCWPKHCVYRLCGIGVALSAETEIGSFRSDRTWWSLHKHLEKSCPKWDSNPWPQDYVADVLPVVLTFYSAWPPAACCLREVQLTLVKSFWAAGLIVTKRVNCYPKGLWMPNLKVWKGMKLNTLPNSVRFKKWQYIPNLYSFKRSDRAKSSIWAPCQQKQNSSLSKPWIFIYIHWYIHAYIHLHIHYTFIHTNASCVA